MRLIDADNLKIKNVSADYWYTVMGVTEDDIDNAPTVKAIPIEWIEEYYRDITSPYSDTRTLFKEMIRKWEKENKPIVDAEPTVEAIPIHWILHYVDTHYNVDNYDDIWRYIMKMHNEWEKENE